MRDTTAVLLSITALATGEIMSRDLHEYLLVLVVGIIMYVHGRADGRISTLNMVSRAFGPWVHDLINPKEQQQNVRTMHRVENCYNRLRRKR